MELPNKYFKDFPIEYKKIKKKSVSGYSDTLVGKRNLNGFLVNKKVHRETSSKYLNEDLQSLINLEEKDTMVISAPVGNGKSYAIIQTIKRFYDAKDQEYLIVVATPFVSLVEQYVNDIHNKGDIPADQIFNYGDLGRTNSQYISKKVHVVTANTLLGNPGEDSYKNSNIKRIYLNDLIADCEKSGRKVVFIYDEVHDTIPNFKEEYIFNLWKWKNVIHKNFVISATFTEASFVVIEYLAELTDKQINIVEFPRLINEENQSKLFLHYSSAYQFTSTTPEIVSVIHDLLNRNKEIDILCYSKILSKAIINDKNIGKQLKQRFSEINDCTSENINNVRPKNEKPTNRFDNSKCNIGTNFKSGVSIEKDNHAFVVILPPRSTQNKFKNYYGIFSSGITSIIQALARQRKVGEIHIVLPRPNEFVYESLKPVMSDEQILVFSEFYEKVKNYASEKDPDKVHYIPLSYQESLVRNFYFHDLKSYVDKGIQFVSETARDELARLEYPPYKNFKLSESENYLASAFNFFGGDLSAYVTYCAISNQFVNCTLHGYSYKSTLWFEEGKTYKQLYRVFSQYFGKRYASKIFTYSNFHRGYLIIREKLFKEFDLRFKSSNSEEYEGISSYSNSHFEQQLLYFIAYYYYGKPYDTNLEDVTYSRGQYFIDCIVAAKNISLEGITDSEFKQRVQAYQDLEYFRNKLCSNFGRQKRGNDEYNYLPVNPFPNFIETSEISRFNRAIYYLTKVDSFVSNNIFNFSRRFGDSFEKNRLVFYKILLEDFFEYESRPNNPRLKIYGEKRSVLPNIRALDIPETSQGINLIQQPDYTEGLLNDEFREVLDQYGTMEAYTKMLVELVLADNDDED